MWPGYGIRELICQCPSCLTFETLLFRGDVLIPTKRFKQKADGQVYHDCGTDKPCRLFPKLVEPTTDFITPALHQP